MLPDSQIFKELFYWIFGQSRAHLMIISVLISRSYHFQFVASEGISEVDVLLWEVAAKAVLVYLDTSAHLEEAYPAL